MSEYLIMILPCFSTFAVQEYSINPNLLLKELGHMLGRSNENGYDMGPAGCLRVVSCTPPVK